MLNELALRCRRYCGLAQSAKYEAPLIIVVTKSDTWSHLVDVPNEVPCKHYGRQLASLDVALVQRISKRVREVMLQACPQVVNSAEAFSKDVSFIPVSAVGGSPTVDARTGSLVIRPASMQPRWVTVPLLYALARLTNGLI
jgi:hypothetical protein